MRGLIFFIIVPLIYIFSLPWLGVVHGIKRINKDLGLKLAYSFNRFICIVTLLISGAKYDIEGIENLKKHSGSLYISNHKSMLDITLLEKYINDPVIFISKKSIAKWPVVSWWMTLAGTLYMDRTNIRESARVIKTGIGYLQNGQQIALFPEGTRGKEDVIQEFKAGSFKLATRSGAPIIPIAIKGTDDVFEKNRANLKPETIYLRIGEPIIYSELEPEIQKDIVNYVRDIIVEMYESI